MRLTATVSGSVSIKIMNNTCSESSGREFYPSLTSTLLHVMYWTFRCYVVLIPSLPLPSFLDPLGAHEPVAAVEPPRARDIDHAAGPGGHPRRRRRRRGHGGGQQPNATPLREGCPGGSPWVTVGHRGWVRYKDIVSWWLAQIEMDILLETME